MQPSGTVLYAVSVTEFCQAGCSQTHLSKLNSSSLINIMPHGGIAEFDESSLISDDISLLKTRPAATTAPLRAPSWVDWANILTVHYTIMGPRWNG